jgi:superfamily II DNA or RNA helicase
MPQKPTVEYPRTPPPWLDQWPAEKAVRELFPEGVRRLAYRFLGLERHRRLTWNAERLVFELGSHQATWRRVAEGWRRSCTCGYVNDCCGHAYAAACVLAEIIRHERWTATAATAGPGSPTTPDQGLPAPAGPVSAPAATPATPRPTPPPVERSTLEVEADFHHEPGLVILRFYRRADDRRELLRLQTLNNLAVQARFGSASNRWSFEDWSLLKWLAPHLQRRGEVRANLQVLKLSRDEFSHWLERWEDGPPRFLERSSQQAISRRGLEPARLAIELTDEGEWVRIAAVLVLPSGGRLPLHSVLERLAAGGQESVVSGELLRFQPPLSWDLLTRVFGRKDPRMRREHVGEHLADLLEGRLDLVEGECVRRESVPDRDLSIEAAPDGSDVLLTATACGAPVATGGATVAGIRWDGTQFVLALCDTPTVRALREALTALGATPAGSGRLRLRGMPAQMTALRQTWARLPAGILRRCQPELRALLDGRSDVSASLILSDTQRSFVDLGVRWECGGVPVADGELREALRLGQGALRTRDGQWLALDAAQARALAQRLEAQGLTTSEPLRLLRHEAKERLRQLGGGPGAVPWTPACRHLGERLLLEPAAEPLPLPEALAGVLRPYQETGFRFLADRSAHGVGAILADDMGLGKTLQVLALIEAWVRRRQAQGQPFRALVVCPASVVAVWLDQAAQFCPGLRCRATLGEAEARRTAIAQGDVDVLVTHYALLRQDADLLTAQTWDLVALDEAQNIKNPEAQVTRVAKALRTPHTLALTGTPLENRLLDLWSVMDFLNPGLLGTAAEFMERYGSTTRLRDLSARIAPLLLRRTKDTVAPELPPRTEELLRVEMAPGQRQFYDRELLRAREELATRGPFAVLAALTRLRQVCCDPALLAPELQEAGSGKTETLVEMLVELAEEGHFSLVFSQFTSMLERLRTALDRAGLPYRMITGDTPLPRRAELVRDFTEAATPEVFLLSLRAAGTGLTLTRADYVFIFDPWWNPAVERQAIDRTHRLGQEKPVFAYRLVAADSVEEKVLALQQEKAALFAAVVGDAEERALVERLSVEDLRRLLA